MEELGVGSETRVLGQSHEPFMVLGISQAGGRRKGRCLSYPSSGIGVFFSLLFYYVVPKHVGQKFTLYDHITSLKDVKYSKVIVTVRYVSLVYSSLFK